MKAPNNCGGSFWTFISELRLLAGHLLALNSLGGSWMGERHVPAPEPFRLQVNTSGV